MMKKIILVLAVLIVLFLSVGCGKNMKPYSKEEVLKFAKESYHKDFKIIETEEISKAPAKMKYTLVDVENEDLEFIIEVEVFRYEASGSIMGPYKRHIYPTYIEASMKLVEGEIEELTSQMKGRIRRVWDWWGTQHDTFIDTAYVFEFADLEMIADYIVRVDRLYNFSYDPGVKNPISEERKRLPSINIAKIDEPEEREKYCCFDTIDYSMYGEAHLEYTEVLSRLKRNYIEAVKQGKIIDESIPKDIYENTPFQIIQEVWIDHHRVGNNIGESLPRVSRAYEFEFVFDEISNEYLLRAQIAYPNSDHSDGVLESWVTEYLGGTYEVAVGGTERNRNNIATWTIGNDTFSANVQYKREEIKSIEFFKNEKPMDIKSYKEPKYYTTKWPSSYITWIRLSDLEELLQVKIKIDQIEGIMFMNSNKFD